RFRASSHVIVFVRFGDSIDPVLVAKAPRLPGDHARLEKEAAMLVAAHSWRDGGFDSIPRVVAFEDYGGHRLLIETALVGRAMNPAFVRGNLDTSLETGIKWLLDFHAATAHQIDNKAQWFAKQVELPVNVLENALDLTPDEKQLLAQTRESAETLRNADLPVVVSHNDFSHPNIMLCAGNNLGVVDWELADADGLPAFDLFFFLKYIAFARNDAHTNEKYVAAFREAFFGETAWAKGYIVEYCQAMKLEVALLAPIFVLCWLQYVAGLITRLADSADACGRLDDKTAAWLRQNRYFLLWQEAVQHVEKFQITNSKFQKEKAE
ncbi:MAG: phosphotransferase family protein, partial [bacterium]